MGRGGPRSVCRDCRQCFQSLTAPTPCRFGEDMCCRVPGRVLSFCNVFNQVGQTAALAREHLFELLPGNGMRPVTAAAYLASIASPPSVCPHLTAPPPRPRQAETPGPSLPGSSLCLLFPSAWLSFKLLPPSLPTTAHGSLYLPRSFLPLECELPATQEPPIPQRFAQTPIR